MSDKNGENPSRPLPGRQAGGRFAPGNRANPKGRPRSGLAFAEVVRERIDPHKILDLLQRFLADECVPLEKRLTLALSYVGAGYLRPPTSTAVQIESTNTPALDWSRVSLAERRELLAAIRRARGEADALPAGTGPVPVGVDAK